MIAFRQSLAWNLAKRVALNPVRRTFAKVAYRGRIPLTWCIGNNWGDALSPMLVELLSGRPAQHLDGIHHHRYLVIGSILGGANRYAEVWGSGFIREGQKVIEPPRAIHAVRGPLTRDALRKEGIDCPEIYGDPALLFPRFFNPDVSKQYEVGIIPHYIDKEHPWLERYRNDPKIRVIDIESGIEEFVRAVKSCEVILSSSLHGLICSDAYGIPSAWIRLSDHVDGGDYKFRDYWHSLGAGEPHSVAIDANTSIAKAAEIAALRPLRIDLRGLMLSCPFLCPELRKEIENTTPTSCGLPERFVMRMVRESNSGC